MRHVPSGGRVVRAVLSAVLAVAIPASATALAPASTTPAPLVVPPTQPVAEMQPTDASLTTRLRARADQVRREAGRESLFTRPSYVSTATRITTAIAQGQPVPGVPDRAPLVQLGGTSTAQYYEAQVDGAIGAVVDAARNVLAYPLHTDAGWSVTSARLSDGRIRWGVALIVGWPAPAVATGTGCASNGYCWSARGLNPHLPWTRNTVTVHLSTANLPANGETLVKAAIATLNRVSGFGADLVYGGRTSATTPNGANRFLVVFGSGCDSTALACTTTGTQGTYDLIYQARMVVTRAKYDANPSPSLWVGTLIHELGHAVGLGHFDGTYLSTYQNMRWAGGPNSLQAGDANGLRRLAPGGRVSARVRAVRALSDWTLVVHTANSGLGGIRSIATQCTDATGAWRTVGTVTGRFDSKPGDRTVGTVAALATSRQCRAVVRSKTASVTSPAITVSG